MYTLKTPDDLMSDTIFEGKQWVTFTYKTRNEIIKL